MGQEPGIGFTGHVNDGDTGLVYMQQRYYDPVAGRMLSIDPVLADSNTGSSFNRYTYANNNPYMYIDPDGREAVCDFTTNCSQYNADSSSTQLARDVKVGATVGAVAGAGVGALLAGGCDAVTVGACLPANPWIVVGSAASGAVAGGILIPPVMASSRELAKNIEAAFGTIKLQGQASHHIVAINDPRAKESRLVLEMVGMDINSAFNGMNMNSKYHYRLHSAPYHLAVQRSLFGLDSYTKVAATLTAIRFQINMGTFPF
jgi:RHS repeat-associated protein